jgi:hypothetical protein
VDLVLAVDRNLPRTVRRRTGHTGPVREPRAEGRRLARLSRVVIGAESTAFDIA